MNNVSEISASPKWREAPHVPGAREGGNPSPGGMRAWMICDAPERHRWLTGCLPQYLLTDGSDISQRQGDGAMMDADLCVIDEGKDGLQTVRHLRDRGYGGTLLVIAPCEEHQWIADVLAGGADGVACRLDPPDEIARVLQEIREGRPALSASAVQALIAHVRGVPAVIACEYRLTAREREIIALANKGYTFPQTAALIGVRISTVYTHVRRLYEKMSVNSLPQALFEARRAGLL